MTAHGRRLGDNITWSLALKTFGAMSTLIILMTSMVSLSINYGISKGEQRKVNIQISQQVTSTEKTSRENEKEIAGIKKDMWYIKLSLQRIEKSVGNN